MLSTEDASKSVINKFIIYLIMSVEPDLKNMAIPPSPNPIVMVKNRAKNNPAYLPAIISALFMGWESR